MMYNSNNVQHCSRIACWIDTPLLNKPIYDTYKFIHTPRPVWHRHDADALTRQDRHDGQEDQLQVMLCDGPPTRHRAKVLQKHEQNMKKDADFQVEIDLLNGNRWQHIQIYFWVNYNDLTATSLEIMVNKGNHPKMALIQVSEIL